MLISPPHANSPDQAISNLPGLAEMNISINFINFDQELLDLSTLQDLLDQTTFVQYYGNIQYSININLQVPNASYTEQVNNYIDTISSYDWTSKLNETAIEEQKQDFKRKKIFEQQNGTAIQARDLEQYLVNNIPETSLNDNNLYHMFVFNLSRLDVGSNKHWLNATEIDPDAGTSRFYWRTEWDYPLNYDVKFPYAAFSEQTEIAILDPTSFQWILNWRSNWNYFVNYHPSYNNTLSELIQGKTTTEAKAVVTNTNAFWITDWLNNIYGMDANTREITLGDSVDAQMITIYNSSQKSVDEIKWIINEQIAIDEIGFILDSQNVSFTTAYYDINQDEFLRDIVNNAEINYTDVLGIDPPFENWRYYNGFQLADEVVLNNTLNELYFNATSYDLHIKGLILIIDNASYVLQFPAWPGGLYTGVGGGQIVSMLWELDRAFMPDGTSKKAGLSKVLIHELAHSVGLPHTFSNSFISDFISDVMGYFPGNYNFSKLIPQSFWRRNIDSQLHYLMSNYTYAFNNYAHTNTNDLIEIENIYTQVMGLHAQKRYLEAYRLIMLSFDIFNSIFSADPVPSSSSSDQIPNPSSSNSISSSSSTHTPINSDTPVYPSEDDVSIWNNTYLMTLSIVVLLTRKNKNKSS